MTGLRRRLRDPEIPVRAGQPELRPLDVREVEELVRSRLLREDAPPIAEVTWEYARWKPGLSQTSAYMVRFEDGEERTLALKVYADGKPEDLAGRVQVDPRVNDRCDRLRAFVVDAERACVAWSFPFDRVLRGLPGFLDPRFLARMIEQAGVVPPRSIRRRRITWQPLRYKPERRALWTLRLEVRGEESGQRAYLGRILPPAVAGRSCAARRALESSGAGGLVPAALVLDAGRGITLEEWLELRTFAPDSFYHAPSAGAALARLHGLGLPDGVPAVPAQPLAHLESLYSIDSELARSFASLRLPAASGPFTWTHGDFHPDQVAMDRDTERMRLLDLDLVGPGDPVRDLASWIADHLLEGDTPSPVEAAGPLLDGYRSGGCSPVNRSRLWGAVTHELVHRGAAAIRRLEHGALEKAARALLLARDLAPGGAVVR